MVLKNVSSCSTGQALCVEAAGSWLREIKDQSVHYHPILPCYANQTLAAYMFDNLLLSMQCVMRAAAPVHGHGRHEAERAGQVETEAFLIAISAS
jgi:hypothetical protein